MSSGRPPAISSGSIPSLRWCRAHANAALRSVISLFDKFAYETPASAKNLVLVVRDLGVLMFSSLVYFANVFDESGIFSDRGFVVA